LLSSLSLINFDFNSFYFQQVTTVCIAPEYLNLFFSFGFDGVSILFFWLSTLLIFSCTLFIFEEQQKYKLYALLLLLLEFLLILVFSVLDLLLFYVFFEAILIPMYLLIGVLGSRERKIRAGYLLFFYTLTGSLLMLLGILYIYTQVGTFNLEYILCWSFSFEEQLWLWLAFFLSFASKIPMFPFHIWLPEAHVEAPTVGSVILAGILLKLGVYGFLRFSLLFFPLASLFFSPTVYIMSIIGVVYASFCAIRQTDFKRIIAYSSVAHMNLVTLGIFSFNTVGLEGALLQSVSHGFVSSALFLLIGLLYNRYHSRLLYYYGGLVHTMPLYSGILLFFTMSNIALPGTSSFIGEFLLLLGVFKISFIISLIATTGVVLCGAYSLWLYNKITFGNLKTNFVLRFKDISFREFSTLLPLVLLVFFLGLFPSYFLKYFDLSVSYFSFIS
jgi:proton-translocating NADH-quinone oxidoreductase chain M